MGKKLKDYLHLYIGCEIQYPDTDGKLMIAKLTGVSRADGVETTYLKRRKKGHAVGDYLSWEPNGHHNCDATNIKLILRPLENMTPEEAVEMMNACDDGLGLNAQEAFRYKLSKGFDVFNLIGAGLAIDKTKLKKK